MSATSLDKKSSRIDRSRGDAFEHWFASNFNFSVKERIRFYKRMKLFTAKKKPVKESLENMWARLNRKKDARRSVFKRLIAQLVAGRTFSEAISPYIPGPERLMIFVGEESSQVSKGFDQAIFVASAIQRMRRAITGALAYPIVLFAMLIAMLVAMAYQMVPTMLTMAPLSKWPPVSLWLYTIAMGVKSAGPWIAGVFAVLAVITARTMPTWTGPVRKFFDRFVPPWTIYREYQSSTFLISLAALVEAGRPVDVALKQIAPISRPWLRAHVVQMVRNLTNGTEPGRAVDVGLLNNEVCGDIEDFGSAGAFDEAIGSVGKESVEDSIERIQNSALVVRVLMMFLVAAAILLIYTGMVFLVMEVGKGLNGFK